MGDVLDFTEEKAASDARDQAAEVWTGGGYSLLATFVERFSEAPEFAQIAGQISDFIGEAE